MCALDGAEATAHRRSPVVLVVDDNELARTLLSYIVQGQGFEARFAADGWQAVEICSRETVDLVILDVVMPGMDGPKTLEMLKLHNPGIRCCFATGGTKDYTDEDLLERGAARVFKKPFSALEIGQGLQHLLKDTARAVG
jgi:CheY-like chemotaxis protein